MRLSIGQLLRNNRYRIDALLGQGGMGAVYRAWDTSLDIPVAVKENLDTSAEAQKQFGREAQLLARLAHPSLPRVTDYFFIPGQGQYLVMDFVEGEDLEAMVRRLGALPEPQVLNWIAQVCDALAYLHSQPSPVIHRDIKPANIKIRGDGRAMLVDFGIAKVFDPVLATTMGARAVSPGYSPPEQYGGGVTDPRSDVYALGATLYHLLTGCQPPESVQRAVGARMPLPRQVNGQISPMAEQTILKAIEVATDRRFQSVGELKAALMRPRPGATGRAAAPAVAPSRARPVRPPAPRGRQGSRYLVPGLAAGAGLLLVLLVVATLAALDAFDGAQPTPPALAAVVPTDEPVQLSTLAPRPALTAEGGATEPPSPMPPAPTATDTSTPVLPTLMATDTATPVPPTPTATCTPRPTLTRTPRPPTATPTPKKTARPAATVAPPSWPVVMFEGFDTNGPAWIGDDECRKGSAADGTYRIEFKSPCEFSWWHWLAADPGSDFYLAVDAKLERGSTGAEQSLIFHSQEQGTYLFQVGKTRFRVMFESDPDLDLIGWTTSSAIKPGQMNHLAVIGHGSHYEFMINGVRVAQLDDTRLGGGGSVGIEMYSATQDQSAIFVFDNFELRAP